MKISPELSYYRRVTATPEGRERLALIRRTRRRQLKRLAAMGVLLNKARLQRESNHEQR